MYEQIAMTLDQVGFLVGGFCLLLGYALLVEKVVEWLGGDD
jgi:hypothetical protein